MSEVQEKALNPTVVKLGLVSFFADISSEMLYPITPLFLTSVLGASMTSVGLIEGFAEAIASLLKTYAGSWSDRLGKRKPFVWFGYLLAALAKPLTGSAASWTHVLLARGIDRTGKGLRTAPRDALLADSVPASLRGAAFGWHRGMDTLGAAIGPLLAILFLQVHPQTSDLRTIYYWAVLPGLCSVFIALSLKEKSIPRRTITTIKSAWGLKETSRDFRLYLAGWGVFSLTNSSDVFLLMRAQKSGFSITQTILLYCLYNLVYALLSPGLGHLSDRFGRKNLFIAGLITYALVYLGFSAAQEVWHFWVLFGVYGLYMAATDGVGKALAVDLIPPDRKATGLGIVGTFSGIATLFASTAAGFLWDQLGASSPFYFGAAGAFLGAILLTGLKTQKN